jgi:hypothetical protein
VTENDKSFSTFALLSSTTYLSIIPSRFLNAFIHCGNGQIQFKDNSFVVFYYLFAIMRVVLSIESKVILCFFW